MLLKYLASLGESFLNAGMEPSEILGLISDGKSQGKFLENVAVIEIQTKEGFRAKKYPDVVGNHVEKKRQKVEEEYCISCGYIEG